jgi:hypothetical protein
MKTWLRRTKAGLEAEDFCTKFPEDFLLLQVTTAPPHNQGNGRKTASR